MREHYLPMPAAVIGITNEGKVSGTDKGRVSLVGAGPGDPQLLTMKAMDRIQTADIIIYDRLVSGEIRDLFPPLTPTIFVGKAKAKHSVEQSQINQILIKQASLGKSICRLKGGDPLIFGRGGEEMLLLKKSGVEVEVVPGITAAAGCTAYAGIPLTHRGLSQGCTLITAHAETELQVNWRGLALLDHTLVFYMGLSKSQMISDELMLAGLSATTPVALIEHGCTLKQRVVRGQLSQLSVLVQQQLLQSPTLIIVGKVVDLAQELNWFEAEIKNSSLSEQVFAQLSA